MIARAAPCLDSVGSVAQNCDVEVPEAGAVTDQVEFKGTDPPHALYGRRQREKAPADYGTVELTHSSKADVCEDVVRSLYAHVEDGDRRSKRTISSHVKMVYVPEEDLLDLMQVYSSQQLSELRSTSCKEDGQRRDIRFFYNDGERVSLSASSSGQAS